MSNTAGKATLPYVNVMHGGKAPSIHELSFRHSIERVGQMGNVLMLDSTGYSWLFCNFPQSLQVNVAILLQSRPQPLPFTHLPIIYFHIILPIPTCHHILEDLYI